MYYDVQSPPVKTAQKSIEMTGEQEHAYSDTTVSNPTAKISSKSPRDGFGQSLMQILHLKEGESQLSHTRLNMSY
jgi:hypothetical protein